MSDRPQTRMDASELDVRTVRKNTRKTNRVAKNPQRRRPEYVVPPAVLNVAHGNNGDCGSMPCRDATYPVPDDWIKANASRFYFTDEQILAAAVTEFETPDLPSYARCYLVYFLIRNKEIVYVGISTDFDARLEAHKKSGKRFDSFTWFEAPETYLKQIEAYYIDRIQPEYNADYPSVYGFGRIARTFEDTDLRKIRKEYVTIISPEGSRTECNLVVAKD